MSITCASRISRTSQIVRSRSPVASGTDTDQDDCPDLCLCPGGATLSPQGHCCDTPPTCGAFASGADAVYTARGFMLALGCIQALQCNSGHCPVGITTHDKQLQRGLDLSEKAERVSNYARNLEHTLISLLAATGKRSFHKLTRDDLFLPSQPLEIA